MKITRKQLKQIIAEEHAIVYGTKKPSSRKTRKLSPKQRRIVEAKKKKAILAEVQRNYACDEVLEEGIGKFLKQLGGMFSKGMEQAVKIKDATAEEWRKLGEKIDAEEADMKAFEDEMKQDLQGLKQDIENAVKKYASFKKIIDKLEGDDDAKEEKTKQLYAAGIQLVKSQLAAM